MGLFGSEEIDQVFEYYGIPYEPSVVFNGLEMISGGGDEIASGQPYLDVVTPQIFAPSPIKLEIDSFDPETGNIAVTGSLFSPDEDIIDATIRFILLEDDIEDDNEEIYTHVVRDIIKDDFDLSGQGNTITYDKTFIIPAESILSNLHAVAFVQMPDHEIIQSVSNYQIPDYKVRAIVPFETTCFDPDYDPEDENYLYEGDFFSLVNLGFADELTIVLIIDNAPESWNFSYSDEDNEYENPTNFFLGSGDYKKFRVNIFPDSYGTAEYHFEITSTNSEYVYQIHFIYMNVETNIDDEINQTGFISLHNYPNPFSSSTTISFNVTPTSRFVTLDIYNIKGQKVREFPVLPSGVEGSIIWNSKDENGKPVSPGIYLYKLSGENFQITKKMILLR